MDTDKVIESLAAFTEYDPDDISESYDYAYGDGKVFDVGSREYLVFADDADADEGATEYLTEMLENEPELFNQDWLQGHLEMRPGDIQTLATEEADNYAYDIDDNRAIEEAEMEDEIEDAISKFQDAYDDAEEAYSNAEPGSDEEDELESAMEDAQTELDDAREKAKEDVAERAREEIFNRYFDDLTDRLEKDPLGYFDELGMSAKDAIDRGLLVIDIESAAEEALSMDGRAHFLSSYDGNEEEIEGGFIVFRIN